METVDNSKSKFYTQPEVPLIVIKIDLLLSSNVPAFLPKIEQLAVWHPTCTMSTWYDTIFSRRGIPTGRYFLSDGDFML